MPGAAARYLPRHDRDPRPRAAAATQPRPDPKTAAALVRIAQASNNNYDLNNDGPVWARWDARSQAVISRIEYIWRHPEVPSLIRRPSYHFGDCLRKREWSTGSWACGR